MMHCAVVGIETQAARHESMNTRIPSEIAGKRDKHFCHSADLEWAIIKISPLRYQIPTL